MKPNDKVNGQIALKKAVIYLRVSTEEQVDNYSLDNQEDICRKEAVRRGYEVIMMFREEGRSAKDIVGRPVLIQLIEYCRKKSNKINAVFVYRLDRISRQTSDYLAIRKKLAESEVKILSATEPTGNSPTEKLVETMLAAFGQLDNDIRGERAKTGLRSRFLEGLISTPPPFGYLLQSGYVVKDPVNFDKMQEAWKLMATGTKSIKEMVVIINSWKLINRQGKLHKMIPSTMSRIFRSKFYMGVLTSNRYSDEVKGQHTPMVTEEQFFRVQAILDGRNPNKIALSHRMRDNPVFPLRRITKCGKCGATMTGYWSQGRNQKYSYYRCGKFCTGKAVKTEVLEGKVLDEMKKITPTQENLELLINFIQTHYYKRLARLNKLRAEADGEIAKLYDLRKQLVEKNLSGVYSDEIFKEQIGMVEDKILVAQIAKHDETFEKYDINKLTDFIKTLLADLSLAYKKSDISQKKALLGALFPSGLVWNYNELAHPEIRALYQSMSTFSEVPIASGGERGIRTPDDLAAMLVFKTSPINHSGISPWRRVPESNRRSRCFADTRVSSSPTRQIPIFYLN